nr:hypothetical protein [Tanacetum cinerariifolium]
MFDNSVTTSIKNSTKQKNDSKKSTGNESMNSTLDYDEECGMNSTEGENNRGTMTKTEEILYSNRLANQRMESGSKFAGKSTVSDFNDDCIKFTDSASNNKNENVKSDDDNEKINVNK